MVKVLVTTPTFITLGPAGTCHENAMLRYLEFQGVEDASIEFVDDFLVGAELVRERDNAFLIQCSAHPLVNSVTERYRHEVYVIDTFLYPAKEMGLMVRAGIEDPKTLGVVPAARGYIDEQKWDTIVEETANPIVAMNLLDGRYDAGVTLVEFSERHPDELRLIARFGEVDTTWVVYGRRRRFQGQLIGQRAPWLFSDQGDPESVGRASHALS